MSDKNSTVEIIDENAIVNIKMSTSFYQRLQILYLKMIKDKTQEEVQKFLEEVKSQSISSEENYNLETMLILLSEFQKNSKAEGFVKTVTQEELQKLTSEKLEQLKEEDQK